jgi:PAS domain S-box-containing protein
VHSNCKSCLETPGRTKSWEARKIRKDSTILWVRDNAKAVERPPDDVIVVIACEDVSQRKQTEAALRAASAGARKGT